MLPHRCDSLAGSDAVSDARPARRQRDDSRYIQSTRLRCEADDVDRVVDGAWMTNKNTNDAAPEIPGWALVDAAFIYARKRKLVEDELLRFFDGQPPTWRHALSSQIPRRNAADQIIEELTSGDSSNRDLRVVLGAAGEGKSTVLLQVAAQMATVEGWRVWWRLRPQSGITEQDVLKLGNSGGNWLLVFDDAETLVDDLGQIFSVLHDVGLDGLHFLCCARDTDWEAVKGPELLLSWAQYIDIPEQQPLRGIDFDDALAIVEAWRGVGERGLGDLRKYQTDDERARALEQAALIPAARPQDGSFFGALLKVRFTKEGLLSHVANVMQRLTTRAVAQDNSLLDAFLYVSAVDAIGIDGLDQTVLADLLGVGRDRLVSRVVRPLADEAAAIPASHSVRTRHSDIARSTLVLVERGRFSTDLTEIFPSIVRQTIRTRKDGLYIHEFPKIIHCSRRLVASLPQDIAREHRRAVAVATAEGAIDEEPARLRYRDDLSQTLRWMGGSSALR
jgi:hypothetical protein